MYSKNTKVYNKYKNENFSPSFGSFFNDNSSIDSVISYEDYNENIIEIQPLNLSQPVEAQNINLYENNINDIENNFNYENESNISSVSNESIESGLMDFYYNSKKYYFSFFFILLIWILYFTINNESLLFYTTTLYPDCKDVRNQVWRLITNCLIHSNLNHILVNSFFLFPFLIINEMMIDKKYLLPILLISVINCNLFFYYSNPYKALLGASGIIFCLSSTINNRCIHR